MIRFLVALSLLLVPTHALAKRGMTTAEPIRYEYVFELAKMTCARLEPQPADRVVAILQAIKIKFRLTEPEVTTLLNYCLMYLEGRSNG